MELGTHDDNCCFEAYANVIVEMLFATNEETQNSPCSNGVIVVLVFNKVLYFEEKLELSLLCPNQLRGNSVLVEDCPMAYNECSVQIHVPSEDWEDLKILLKIDRGFSYFHSQKPMAEEWRNISGL